MIRYPSRLFRLSLALTVLLLAAMVAGCTIGRASLPTVALPSPTPLVSPSPVGTAQTVAQPAPSPTAAAAAPELLTQSPVSAPNPPVPPTAAPSPTLLPPPAVVSTGPLCSLDLAQRPPVRETEEPADDPALQARALVPAARSDATGLGPLTQYVISVTIDLDALRLYGSQVVTVTNRGDATLRELYFGLYPNAPFNGAALQVDSVSAGDLRLETAIEKEGTAMRVVLAQALAPQGIIALQMDFSTTVPAVMPAGYAPIVAAEGIVALAHWYPILLVHDKDGWHADLGPEYGDQVYSEAAYYTVDVTAPANLVVVASGIPFRAETDGHGTARQRFRAGPVRDFYLIASEQFCVVSRRVGEIVVNSYYVSGKDSQGRLALDVAAATLATLAERVGAYPYREFDVVQAPTIAGGVEYPGIVVIGQRYYATGIPSSEMEFVVAHETAHQWWYGVVGNDQINEPWLDEALANYSTVLYWEATHGRRAAEDLVRQVLQAPYENAVRAGRDMAVNLPVAAYGNSGLYSAMVYDKGALFFANLRAAIGDDPFFRLLQEYYATYRYEVARGDDFMRLARQIAGARAQEVYDAWVVGVRR